MGETSFDDYVRQAGQQAERTHQFKQNWDRDAELERLRRDYGIAAAARAVADLAAAQAGETFTTEFALPAGPYKLEGVTYPIGEAPKRYRYRFTPETGESIITPEPPAPPKRPTRSESFMDHAYVTAQRGTCPRAAVGCVIVKHNHIIVSGYNGAPAGEAHCTDAGCDLEDGHCVRSSHAEANAIAFAAQEGIATHWGTAFTTHYPCWSCTKLLFGAGITTIFYDQPYRADRRVVDLAAKGHITVKHYSKGPQ